MTNVGSGKNLAAWGSNCLFVDVFDYAWVDLNNFQPGFSLTILSVFSCDGFNRISHKNQCFLLY